VAWSDGGRGAMSFAPNKLFFGMFAVSGLAGCATLPDMPPDYALPVREIILHAVCELRFALQAIEVSNPDFHADQWAIAITLTPKVDTELSARAGLTGKSSSKTVPFFNTWAIGGAPGAQYDMKGHKDGTAKYVVHSRELLNDKKHPLNCETSTSNYHALAGQLGIQDWVTRTASAAEGQIGKLTRLDVPTYNSQIIILWDGSGNFTYTYPFGTEFLGLYASYKVDESLAIAFTSDPDKKPIQVRTLPSGTGYSSVSSGSANRVSPQAQSRLDILGLEQTIRNLEVSTTQRRR